MQSNKRKLSLLLFVFACIFISIAATKPSATTTKHVTASADTGLFKNLKILPKDISKEQLDTIMHRFNAALGVKCNFCHAFKDGKPDFPSDEKKEKDIEQNYIQLKQTKEELLHKKGSVENQQKYLAKIKNEFEQEQGTIAQLHEIIEDYQTIAHATGKDGIQALLIEEAIPEIEQEANYLLSRLTNNQAQIFIESLRDLKKGGTKETLDIKISDQAGIRSYELFSGGEAFRIDFALRIAISKLLARRAGTALQILIIDEGFGSQDEEGLGYIMDALYKIQDDFSKIIIVSHLPSMKDQFPVQFFIEKKKRHKVIKLIL